MNHNEFGFFCEIYGKTLRNKILEFILEHESLDFAASDILEEVNISKPALYSFLSNFKTNSIIIKSRIVGGTQLFRLNKNDDKAKILLQSFNECLKKLIKPKNRLKPEIHSSEKIIA